MLNKWQKLAPAEKKKIKVLLAFAMVALYSPVYFKTNAKLQHNKNMVNRIKDRISKRTAGAELGQDIPNSRVVENRQKKIEEKIAILHTKLNNTGVKFAPIDSAEDRQALKVEFSTLAEKVDLELLSVSRRGASVSGEDDAKLVLDKSTHRPLVDVEARAGYVELLNFLDGLETLSYQVAVMNIRIYAQKERQGRAGRKQRVEESSDSRLFIFMEVSI